MRARPLAFVFLSVFAFVANAQAQSAPSISSLSQPLGPGNTPITITGASFGATQGASFVTFGSTVAPPSSWSDTSIVVPVPNSLAAGDLNVTVTVGGVPSNSVLFTVIPVIYQLSTYSALAGTQVTITGVGFSGTQGTSNITFNGLAAAASSWSNSSIVTAVPIGASTGPLVVTVNSLATNSVNFTVPTPTPTVTSLSPGLGPIGTPVTIIGTNLGDTQGNSRVLFPGLQGSPASFPTSWSATSITVPVPTGAITGRVSVMVNGRVSNSFRYVVGTLNISGISPTSGGPGTTVTITGSGFGSTQTTSLVTFNGIPATVSAWSNIQVVAIVPNNATSGNVFVIENNTPSNGVQFSVGQIPNITSVSPTSGPGATAVTVTGTNFGATRGSGQVLLGSVNGLVSSWSDTRIVALVAPSSSSGTVQVLQAGFTSNALNFVVTTPHINAITPTGGRGGTQVTISGSGFGATQGNGFAILGTNNAVVVNWTDTSVVALVAQGSSSGTAQIIQNRISSNSLNFTVSAPSVTHVSPTVGLAGTQVTITGSGFGSPQGSGRVLLGTAFGSVVSWSDTQIVANVAPGSSSGSAQVQQGGAWSNLTDFTVNTPTITSIDPTTGSAGTQVTIAGFYFGPAQGTGKVWLGNAYGSVVNWTDNQVIATFAPGALSGKAQILQNGVWSNAINFSTDTPQITSVNPASGVAGTNVTVTGSGFGATQASGDILLGNVSAQVVTWSDTQVVATVASGAITGIARISQNTMTSNSRRFVVPTVAGGNVASLVPYLINMLVGETRSIQALDVHNQPVSGLAWATSDSGVVSLSTDDPPILTGVAPGHAVITAGDATSDITVLPGSALLPGTVIWSLSESNLAQAIPAVPSPTGVADIFTLQSSGVVQAVQSDGTVAWTAAAGSNPLLLPDFQGGLAISTADAVKRFDGLSGQQVFNYNFANPAPIGTLYKGKHPVAVHPDGTIFVVDGNLVVAIDSQSGSTKFSISLEQSPFFLSSECQDPISSTSPTNVGPVLIAGDGYFYMPYNYSEGQHFETNISDDPSHPVCTAQYNDFAHLRLLRLGTDGSVQKIVMGDWGGYLTTDYADGEFVRSSYPVPQGDFESLITNADKGVLFTWSVNYEGGCSYQVYNLVSGQTDSSGCFPNTFDIKLTDTSTGITADTGNNIPAPVLQAQDGTFIGNVMDGNEFIPSLAAFNPDGTIKWGGPVNAQALYSLADGSTIARLDSGQFISFDQNGGANGQLANPLLRSWTGAYQTGSSSLDAIVRPYSILASTYAAIRGPLSLIPNGFLENGIVFSVLGNPSGNGAAVQQEPFPPIQSCAQTNNNTICPYDSLLVGLDGLQAKVGGLCPDCARFVFGKINSSADQSQFSRFITRFPGFFDGTKSTLKLFRTCEVPITSLTPWDAGYGCFAEDVGYLGPGTTVADFFSQNPGVTALSDYQPSNAQDPAGKRGLLVFFNPSTICTASSLSNSDCQVANKSLLFHEALHEYYGLGDGTIQRIFALPVQNCTANISDYISFTVFSRNVDSCN